MGIFLWLLVQKGAAGLSLVLLIPPLYATWGSPFCRPGKIGEDGTSVCSVTAIRPIGELEGRRQAETIVAVVIRRVVVVAVRDAAVLRFVPVAAAAYDAVVALATLDPLEHALNTGKLRYL